MIDKTFKLFSLLFFSLIILLLIPPVFAQETPEEIAQKYGVTFPIAELGGCENYSDCREYCEDPINQNACIAFAKGKGFYEEGRFEQEQEIVEAAKSELGCTDRSTCLAFCQKEENFERCDNFAKKHKLEGGHIEDPGKQQILQKAQQVLGCDSYQSCKSLCEQEKNREKCDNFAKQVGLRGGEIRQGPGGCTSEETCKAFCSDPNNYQICQGFSQGSGGRFVGPGGCNSEASCRAYCQEHPQECEYGAGQEPGSYNPQEMCLRTSSCKWENNTCQCGFYGNPEESQRKSEEYAKYCRENPEKCKPGQMGGFDSIEERKKFESYCQENPERCKTDSQNAPPSYPSPQNTSECPAGYYRGPGGYCTRLEQSQEAWNCTQQGKYWDGSTCRDSSSGGGGIYPTSQYNPADECQKNSNCRWENNTCQCTSSGSNPSPDPIQACQSQSGCRWEDNTCKCESSSGTSGGTSGSSGESPQDMCNKTSGCSWVDNTCKCSQVQGAATSPTSFLNYVRLLFPFLFK